MADEFIDRSIYAHVSRRIGASDRAPAFSQAPAESLPPSGIQLPGGGMARVTVPGQRPLVPQVAVNITVAVTDKPTPIQDKTFLVDAIVLAVPNGGSTVFFGYGSQTNVSSGIPIIANVPVDITPENQREEWELQRCLEIIAQMVSGQPMPPYRAPRVVLDVSSYFLVAAPGVTQNVAAMLFLPPEGQ